MDAILFKKLLKQEQKALACAWEAFLSIQKEGKVPYPVNYSQIFTRIQSQKEFAEPELFSVLKESKVFLDTLLSALTNHQNEDTKIKIELNSEKIDQIYQLKQKIEN